MIRNLLLATVDILDMALGLYMFLIIARAVISWVSPDPYNPIVQFLYKTTEPALRPIRRWLPVTGIDISPIILIFAVVFLRRAVIDTLRQIALTL